MDSADFVIDVETVRSLVRTDELRPDLRLDRWLAIGVAGTALVRKTWYDDTEVSEALFEELTRTLPPVPDLGAATRHRELDAASRHSQPTRCRACAFSPGKNPCPNCSGQGEIVTNRDGRVKCLACENGTIRCPVCDGSRESYDVRVAYHEDNPLGFAHVFVPEDVPALRSSVIAFLSWQSEVPAVLALDLTGEFAARDAYRGRRGDHEHHGHRFGGALTLARRYLERVVKSPSVITSRHSAMGWPFATLAHQPSTGFAIDAKGRPHRL